MIQSQTKIARKQMASSPFEPAHNGKISVRSPLSNAKTLNSMITANKAVAIVIVVLSHS